MIRIHTYRRYLHKTDTYIHTHIKCTYIHKIYVHTYYWHSPKDDQNTITTNTLPYFTSRPSGPSLPKNVIAQWHLQNSVLLNIARSLGHMRTDIFRSRHAVETISAINLYFKAF